MGKGKRIIEISYTLTINAPPPMHRQAKKEADPPQKPLIKKGDQSRSRCQGAINVASATPPASATRSPNTIAVPVDPTSAKGCSRTGHGRRVQKKYYLPGNYEQAGEDMTATADDRRQRLRQKKTGWGGRGGG